MHYPIGMTPGPKPRELTAAELTALDRIEDARHLRDRADADLDAAIDAAVSMHIPARHIADAAGLHLTSVRRRIAAGRTRFEFAGIEYRVAMTPEPGRYLVTINRVVRVEAEVSGETVTVHDGDRSMVTEPYTGDEMDDPERAAAGVSAARISGFFADQTMSRED